MSLHPPYIAPGPILMVPVTDGLVIVGLDCDEATKLLLDLALAIAEAKR
jgi:hypothetical protein